MNKNIIRINGAIFGLEALQTRFNNNVETQHKRNSTKGFLTLSSKDVIDLINQEILIYKDIKIKELEKGVKEKVE